MSTVTVLYKEPVKKFKFIKLSLRGDFILCHRS